MSYPQQERNRNDLVKTSLKAFVLVLVVAASAADAQPPSAESTHLYSPATNLERSELEMLRTARRTVDVAMYSFTDREIAQELVELERMG